MTVQSDGEFLAWVADRIEQVYGDDPNLDYVRRLRDISGRVDLEGRIASAGKVVAANAHLVPGTEMNVTMGPTYTVHGIHLHSLQTNCRALSSSGFDDPWVDVTSLASGDYIHHRQLRSGRERNRPYGAALWIEGPPPKETVDDR